MRDTEVTKELKVRIDKRKVTGWAGGRAGVVTCEEPMTYRDANTGWCLCTASPTIAG